MSTIAQASANKNVPMNKGFIQVAEKFNNIGWDCVEDTQGSIIYVYHNYKYDEFKVRATKDEIEVVIPLPNSPVAYCTKFSSYFDASEYVQSRLDDYLAAIKIFKIKIIISIKIDINTNYVIISIKMVSLTIRSRTPEKVDDYALVTVKVDEVSSPLNKNYNWMFISDKSGSMSLVEGKQQRTRLDNLKDTLIRIIEYLYEQAKNKSMTHDIWLLEFDSEVKKKKIFIDENTDCSEIVDYIKKIKADGMTDISKALNMAKTLKFDDNSLNTTIAFMSDGEATTGIQDPDLLKEKLSEILENGNINSQLIGYSADHCYALMQKLNELNRTDYHCISSIESSSSVYADMMHNVMYETGKNIKITINGGLVYDFKSNLWVSSLSINQFVSGSTKSWILKKTTDDIEIIIEGEFYYNDKWSNKIFKQSNIDYPEKDNDILVEKYLLRQKTQVLMAEAKKIKQTNNTYCNNNYHSLRNLNKRSSPFMLPPPAPKKLRQRTAPVSNKNNESVNSVNNNCFTKKEVLEAKLKKHLKILKEFIKKNDDSDLFITTLCDDIIITIRALNASNGTAYILSRETSQGLQRGYNQTDLTDLEEDNNYDFNHNLSNSITSPYCTQSSAQMIRSITSN